MTVDVRQWTPAIARNVKIIGQLAFGYKWMHTRAAKFFARRYRYMIHTSSILSGIVSLLLILESIYVRPSCENENNVPILTIISAIFSTFSAVLVEIINATDYQELSGDHQFFAAKYTSIISAVQRQLNLDYEHRDEAASFLSFLAKDFDQLFELAPLIRPSFVKAYTEVAEKKGWPVPEETLLDMAATDIINKDEEVPIVVHHPAVNINERIDAIQNKDIPDVLTAIKADHIAIDISKMAEATSPLSVVNATPDWSLRKQPSTSSSTLTTSSKLTPNHKDRKTSKAVTTSNKAIIEVNTFNNERMKYEMSRMQK
jgi:hypothetical protein